MRRIYKGISGFPKRSESEYDTFGVGHSSTSISGALGMAVASTYKGENDKQHIAVIGDGSMTAGLAFEGLNHAGIENSNLLVILNDNCMSIDPNVGALKEYNIKLDTVELGLKYFGFRWWHILFAYRRASKSPFGIFWAKSASLGLMLRLLPPS